MIGGTELPRLWSAVLTTLLVTCLAAGCGGRQTADEPSASMEDTAAAAARDETGARAPSDSPSADEGASPEDTGAASPAGRDTLRGPSDTIPGAQDTTTIGRFYVRVRATADPDSVARRHGVRPLNVTREPTKGFYAALSRAELAALEADSLVRSIAREIHGGDTTTGPQIRGVPVGDTAREPD